MDIRIERHDEAASTSDLARQRVEAGEVAEPLLIVAGRQTGGRGRFGRAWASPAGGLWCTLIWPLGEDWARVVDGLGLRLGLACLRAVDQAMANAGATADVRLKWPNDVYVNGRKILGLLTEIVGRESGRAALVGVGVNLNFAASELPDTVRGRATTLLDEIGAPVDMEQFTQDLISELQGALRRRGVSDNDIREACAWLHGVGRSATVTLADGSTQSGELLGLSDCGAPILRTGDQRWTAPPSSEIVVERD